MVYVAHTSIDTARPGAPPEQKPTDWLCSGMAVDPERAHFVHPNAAELQQRLLSLTRDLVKDAAKLGEMRDTSDRNAHRKRMRDKWQVLPSTIVAYEREVAREAKQSVRDALHSQLCQIVREAERDQASVQKPWLFWKKEIQRVIDWLDRFIQ